MLRHKEAIAEAAPKIADAFVMAAKAFDRFVTLLERVEKVVLEKIEQEEERRR